MYPSQAPGAACTFLHGLTNGQKAGVVICFLSYYQVHHSLLHPNKIRENKKTRAIYAVAARPQACEWQHRALQYNVDDIFLRQAIGTVHSSSRQHLGMRIWRVQWRILEKQNCHCPHQPSGNSILCSTARERPHQGSRRIRRGTPRNHPRRRQGVPPCHGVVTAGQQ